MPVAQRLRWQQAWSGGFCKSGTISRVLFPLRGGYHSSRVAIAHNLKQPTRKLQPGRPQTLSYLVLLRTGFSKLAVSPRQLVSSYLTVSPLPAKSGRSAFCGTLRGSLPLGVTQHSALRSPDFPPRCGVSPTARRQPVPLLQKPPVLPYREADSVAKTILRRRLLPLPVSQAPRPLQLAENAPPRT